MHSVGAQPDKDGDKMRRLGKLDYVHDIHTLMLDEHIDTATPYPKEYDLDKGRAPFPSSSFGNNLWGNCVKVVQTNQTFRLERIERRVTPNITPPDVVEAYKQECMREFNRVPASPGDANDNGLVMLYNLRNWRNVGWEIFLGQKSKKKTLQKIFAFGELSVDPDQMRRSCYLLRGIQFGLNLPKTAEQQLDNNQPWDVVATSSPDTRPGSWGGHAVYSCKYNENGWTVKTWGRNQLVTNEFIDRYADERWAVVDDQDPLSSVSKWLDVPSMVQKLRDMGVVISL